MAIVYPLAPAEGLSDNSPEAPPIGEGRLHTSFPSMGAALPPRSFAPE